jgi:hypothetical protein
MGSGHLPFDFRTQLGEIGAGHFASIEQASDTSGHSLAFFEKCSLVRFAADGDMIKADAMLCQLI